MPVSTSDVRSQFSELDEPEEEEEDEIVKLSISDEDGPARVEKMVRNIWNEPIRKSRSSGAVKTTMPDFASMASVGKKTRPRDSMNEPYDDSFIKDPFSGALLDALDRDYSVSSKAKPRFDNQTMSMLNKLSDVINISNSGILAETDEEEDLEIIIESDEFESE
jgi:hypothetical protein